VAAAGALTAAGRLAAATELAWSALALPLPAATSARLRCTLSSALWMSGRDCPANSAPTPRSPGSRLSL
jgi:hypothetical protein